MPLLASEAMKPKLCGPLMPQRENVTGIDPATCSADPSLRPDTVTTTGREIPCIARRPVTRSVTVGPEAKPAFSVTGLVSVTIATGSLLVSRLFANCGCVFPPTFMRGKHGRVVAARPGPGQHCAGVPRARPRGRVGRRADRQGPPGNGRPGGPGGVVASRPPSLTRARGHDNRDKAGRTSREAVTLIPTTATRLGATIIRTGAAPSLRPRGGRESSADQEPSKEYVP